MSPSASPRTLVLDLDGTLCLGDAPVRAVLDRALAFVAKPERAPIRDLMERYLAGDHAAAPECRDGYQALTRLLLDAGLERPALSAAFMATREDYRSWLPEVHAPWPLLDVLAAMRGVRRVLATNSPAVGMQEILAEIGVLGHVDEVITDAGKPVGMPTILDRLGVPGRASRHALAGIGDIWANDLAEIHRRGGATFHIDHADIPEGEPTAVAATPEALAGALREWADAMPHPSSDA